MEIAQPPCFMTVVQFLYLGQGHINPGMTLSCMIGLVEKSWLLGGQGRDSSFSPAWEPVLQGLQEKTLMSALHPQPQGLFPRVGRWQRSVPF